MHITAHTDKAQPSTPTAEDARIDETASVATLDTEQPRAGSDEKEKDVPPDGGYGWVCVACVAMINAHSWGM